MSRENLHSVPTGRNSCLPQYLRDSHLSRLDFYPLNIVLPSAYFRYHQPQPCLTSAPSSRLDRDGAPNGALVSPRRRPSALRTFPANLSTFPSGRAASGAGNYLIYGSSVDRPWVLFLLPSPSTRICLLCPRDEWED